MVNGIYFGVEFNYRNFDKISVKLLDNIMSWIITLSNSILTYGLENFISLETFFIFTLGIFYFVGQFNYLTYI